MRLYEQMISDGSWCFRWRSYLPLAIFPLLIMGCLNYHHPLGSEASEEWWELGCVLLAMCGLAMRVAIVGFVPRGTSGRNTRSQKASTLNTTGLYSVVRHPLYVANFLIFLSVLVFLYNWQILAIGCLLYWMYYERIMICEENFLKESFGAEFDRWAKRTPAVIPKLSNWRSSTMSFSWRSALRREYSTLLAIAATMTALEFSTDWWLARHVKHMVIPTGFLTFLLISLIIYVTLRLLKKHTCALDVVGR